jgi:CheY-like chemotaxis protein
VNPTRIIVVSGKDRDSLDNAKLKGAFMVLSKPIDPHELAQAVAKATLL